MLSFLFILLRYIFLRDLFTLPGLISKYLNIFYEDE